MCYYISFDGGGSKLNGVLFDSNYEVLSTATAGGVNLFVHTREESDNNIRECVRELLAKAGRTILEIDAVYASQGNQYPEIIREFLPCRRMVDCGEGTLGLLTCGLTSGLCALSGTGSDIFYVKNGKICDILGGWGYVLGDAGSGFWIGREAVCSMFRYTEGVTRKTILHKKIEEEHGIHDQRELFHAIYSRPSPAYYIASFCRTVNHAAREGDIESRALLREAGEALAVRLFQMIEKHHLFEDTPICTAGSVFRHCSLMDQSFEQAVRAALPRFYIYYPVFEPVAGGLLYCMMENGEEITPGKVEKLQEKYPMF